MRVTVNNILGASMRAQVEVQKMITVAKEVETSETFHEVLAYQGMLYMLENLQKAIQKGECNELWKDLIELQKPLPDHECYLPHTDLQQQNTGQEETSHEQAQK